ncbi:MAG: cyclic nucleotide-binding domain-containing protein [bacterium]
MDLSAQEVSWIFQKLKELQNLSTYSASDLEQLIERMEKRSYAIRDTIIKQGDEGEFFFIIYKGQVGISVKQGNKATLIASLADGDYFGEMSLITNKPCIATVTAIIPTDVFMLPHDDLRFMLLHNPALVKSMSQVVEERRKELFQELGILTNMEDDLLTKLQKYFDLQQE